jgi:hypothetical protein
MVAEIAVAVLVAEIVVVCYEQYLEVTSVCVTLNYLFLCFVFVLYL